MKVADTFGEHKTKKFSMKYEGEDGQDRGGQHGGRWRRGLTGILRRETHAYDIDRIAGWSDFWPLTNEVRKISIMCAKYYILDEYV